MSTYPTLDRNRSYGEVHGENTGGAFFEQDGFLFDFEGSLIEGLLDEAGRKRLNAMMAKKEAQELARQAYEDSLRAAGIDPATQPSFDEQDEEAPEAKVDLRAWIDGRAKYQFYAVRDAIKAEFGFSPASTILAQQYLREKFGIAEAAA